MKKKVFLALKRYFLVLCGIIMVAFAVAVFYTPNKIVSGGVSGVSTILYHLFNVPQGLSYAVINIALLLISVYFLGKEFAISTACASLVLSFFVELFSHIPPITDNPLLAALFGAALYGIGIGLALVNGSSSGGTDIIARLVQKLFPHIKIGNLLLCVDAAVILSALIVFRSIDLCLYGIIALCISSFSINWLIKKLNISKLAFIVSEKGVEISQMLVSTSPRGVTIIDSVGAYTMSGNKVLMCALKESELEAFQKKILSVDENAFIIFSESSQIVGNGFRVYK